jgi:signal transduction histidine kinase
MFPDHFQSADDNLALNLSNISESLDYLKLGEADQQRLREIASLMKEHSQQFVNIFYEHLILFPHTSQFLKNAEIIEQLKKKQSDHLNSMLEANWDEQYVKERFQVGDTHAQVGINPPIFLGGYNQYLIFLLPILLKSFGMNDEKCIEQVNSLVKAVLLDIGLTLNAYFFHSTRALRNALDMLWTANSELRQFAQFTSHDLKTPLATMANLCEEVVDEFGEQIPEDAKQLISSARNHAFRMSALIDELLATSVKLRDETVFETVPLDKPLTEALERVRPVLKEKGIQYRQSGELCSVQGDRIKLREALYNLLSNAAKYIERTPGEISLCCKQSPSCCVLSIQDNGPGIPNDELLHIFAPFRRLPVHKNKPGSGLGLYFTKTLIEQLGGRVWAESKVGEGSTFFLQLPLPSDS